MNALTEIIEDTAERVLAHRIESSMALLEYLSFRASFEEDLSVEQLQQEAVKRGIYYLLGKRYALALQSAITLASEAILNGMIHSTDELALFLHGAAAALACFRRENKALLDLQIEARQEGLYRLLERMTTHESNRDSADRCQHPSDTRSRGCARPLSGAPVYIEVERKVSGAR
jgi:hypothetical protein